MRAQRAHAAALQLAQSRSARRRRQRLDDEAWETSAVVHAKSSPHVATPPVVAMRHKSGPKRGTVERTTAGIHEAAAEYWREIFQQPWDADAAKAADAGSWHEYRPR